MTISSTHWPSQDTRTAVQSAAAGATIVWDFDGVVADTEPVQWASFRTLLGRYGYEPESKFYVDLMGHTEPDIWRILRERGAPVNDIDGLIGERRAIYQESAIRLLRPSWVAHELMNDPTVAAKQVVVSNGDRNNNVALLNSWGMLHLVDVIDRGVRSKADLFLEYIGQGPCVVLEDNAGYAKLARDAGAFVVGVRHSLSPDVVMSANVEVQI